MRAHHKSAMVFFLLVTLSGCASSLVTPTYSPNYETIDKLKKLNMSKVAVDEFEPTATTASVNKITLRGASLNSSSGTYAKYLEDAIKSDLAEMGILDPASNIRIHATILKNDIDVSGISKGQGLIEVKLTIVKGTQVALEKKYVAKTEFDSSFAGAVAIPKGQSEYPNLIRTLLQNIYDDSEFTGAIKQ